MTLSSALPLAGYATPDLTEPYLNIVPRTASEAQRIQSATTPTQDFSKAESFEENPAGKATTRARTDHDAFSQSSDSLSFEQELDFKLGNGLFKKLWVSSPSSTLASDGLGPVYNARSCQRCHLKDGRGHTPEGADDSRVSMFLRLSVPTPDDMPLTEIETYLAALDGDAATPRTAPEPTYGGQLQDLAIQGHAAEAQMDISYTEQHIALSDGEVASLRVPSYSMSDAGYGDFAPDVQISPRVAPPMIGLGLVEAIPVADILAREDVDDADGDGISGRAQVVWSSEFNTPILGRFGWKAGHGTVKEQSADAFAGDIGISSPLAKRPFGDCTEAQAECRSAVHGDGDARGDEIDSEGLDLVAFYSRNLAVPARRDVDDPQVLQGKELFYNIGCASCHTPKYVTHRLEDEKSKAQSFQLIWPYSDFLLHDMGEGLADGRPELRATGTEWRTPPLWGIGMTEQVSGHTQFLHDGRARSLLEAVLWHGGEAQSARDTVVDMPSEDRAALVRFLESL
ncbi:di-heme oxidoredictase family protein [Pacificibacter sp. AS14]|uniref:di-heme oxidoreductase family protein n=1 Tax=Pacificibacter sp. AS14 TaxID=3135785 RepID=UPI003176925D